MRDTRASTSREQKLSWLMPRASGTMSIRNVLVSSALGILASINKNNNTPPMEGCAVRAHASVYVSWCGPHSLATRVIHLAQPVYSLGLLHFTTQHCFVYFTLQGQFGWVETVPPPIRESQTTVDSEPQLWLTSTGAAAGAVVYGFVLFCKLPLTRVASSSGCSLLSSN